MVQNSELNEHISRSGIYHLDTASQAVTIDRHVPNQTEGDGVDHSLPSGAAAEHLTWQVMHGENPAVLVVGGIHGDEFETPEIFEQFTQVELRIPRFQALRANIKAVLLGTRAYEQPTGKVDLNRQFPLTGQERSWEDIFQSVTFPEARLLLQLLKDHPEMEIEMSLHEDPDRSNEFYVYDGVYDVFTDVDKPIVDKHYAHLIAALKAAGFGVLNGLDDPEDPDLGLLAVDGRIYQPLYQPDGTRKSDHTFESAAVELGGLGFTNIKRSFTFEIPGQMSPDRKRELLVVLQSVFIQPLLSELNLA